MIERLIIQPEPVETLPVDPPTSLGRRVQFIATLESSGEFVVKSHQPMADGARELLVRGFDPAVLMTMRHYGNAQDSFAPVPIGHWAKITYSEGDSRRLQVVPWEPFPDAQRRDRPSEKVDQNDEDGSPT